MVREDVLLKFLAVMPAQTFTITQVQKGLFLISRQSADIFETSYTFEPKDYGPSSPKLWDDLISLESSNLVRCVYANRTTDIKEFMATPLGIKHSAEFTDDRISEYILRVVQWVTMLSFSKLVSSILNDYPDMAVNALFRA